MLRIFYRPLNVWYRKSITNVHVQQNKAHAKHLHICTCSEYVYTEKYMIPLAHLSSMLSNEICYAYIQHLHKSSTSAGHTTETLRQEITGTTVHEEKPFRRGLECKRWKHIKVIFVSSHMICYRLGIKGYSTQTVKAQDFWILDSLITYLSQDELFLMEARFCHWIKNKVAIASYKVRIVGYKLTILSFFLTIEFFSRFYVFLSQHWIYISQ